MSQTCPACTRTVRDGVAHCPWCKRHTGQLHAPIDGDLTPDEFLQLVGGPSTLRDAAALLISQAKQLSDVVNTHDALVAALKRLLADGQGCPFCDAGKLRGLKPHSDDCGYAMAWDALALVKEHA